MKDLKSLEKPLKRDDILYRPLKEEGLLVDPKNKKVHSLNTTANFIWSLCDGHHTYQDISKKLSERFDVEEVDIRKDIDCVIATFREHHLLQT